MTRPSVYMMFGRVKSRDLGGIPNLNMPQFNILTKGPMGDIRRLYAIIHHECRLTEDEE
jgi:hypothetical protein